MKKRYLYNYSLFYKTSKREVFLRTGTILFDYFIVVFNIKTLRHIR